MHFPSLIEKKRDGQALTTKEINNLVEDFVVGDLPDYQMSALAMAVFFRGMTSAETHHLTEAMMQSGRVLRYPEGSPPKIDKHSTGGVGDKVSLVLAPLLACDEVWVPMISDRGLGITGGTLDKLESIPGFNVNLDEKRALKQLEKIGVFMIGQTEDICPADKKLYALRDVTGTVPSQPLIVASIMSKKLAENLDRLVLDVKFGSGAFMKTKEEAEQLAKAMTSVGESMKVKTSSLLSPMDEPLGRNVGNALEIAECIEILQGGGPPPCKISTHSAISSALPTARPSGSSIGLRRYDIFTFIDSPTLFIALASFCASSFVFMNAPLPNFTSSTSRSRFSASFLLMMLATMSGCDGTVPVTSRSA